MNYQTIPLPINLLNEFIGQGYSEGMIRTLWPICQGQKLRLRKALQHFSQTGIMDTQSLDQYQMQIAFEASIEDKTPASDRVRISRIPVGLKNVGNSCYFNCFFQLFFFNPILVNQILEKEIQINPKDSQLIQKSKTMFQELQKLFSQMILSDQKYADPTAVIQNIVDDQANTLYNMMNQEDFIEQISNFLYRICDVLQDSQENASNINNTNKMIQTTFKNKFIREQFVIVQEVQHYQNGSLIKTTVEEQFIISLNPKHIFIYQALNETLKDTIESSQIQNRQKKIKIIEFPQTFLFHLQRYEYNREKQRAEKTQVPFALPQYLFLDYLKREVKENSYNDIAVRIKKQMETLQYLQNNNQTFYKWEEKNIIQCLSTVLDYYKSQKIKPDLMTKTIQQLENTQEKLRIEKNNYCEKETQSINELNYWLMSIGCQIHYFLHAIVIHSGDKADSGHYYIFIKNHKTDTWWKFNDSVVSEVMEEEVMNISRQNAYLVAYISEKQKNVVDQCEHTFTLQKEYTPQDYYKKILPANMIQYIKDLNQEFQTQLNLEGSRYF